VGVDNSCMGLLCVEMLPEPLGLTALGPLPAKVSCQPTSAGEDAPHTPFVIAEARFVPDSGCAAKHRPFSYRAKHLAFDQIVHDLVESRSTPMTTAL
jgi:hypothetical protein